LTTTPRARSIASRDISPRFWPNGLVPTSEDWKALKNGGWQNYRLKVGGLVEHPVELSLDDLKAMSKQDQIAMHNCIQGWSAIAEWGGLPFTDLIELVKPQHEARWANCEPLPVLHGSPLRLRVENQLGFKDVKWIREIEFVHDFRDYGAGQGGYNEDHEFYGYRDEI